MAMQIALLSGASPISALDGPAVRLSAGSWDLTFDGKRESEFAILIRSHDPAEAYTLDECGSFVLQKGSSVQLIWKKRGTEKFISVIATKNNGN